MLRYAEVFFSSNTYQVSGGAHQPGLSYLTGRDIIQPPVDSLYICRKFVKLLIVHIESSAVRIIIHLHPLQCTFDGMDHARLSFELGVSRI